MMRHRSLRSLVTTFACSLLAVLVLAGSHSASQDDAEYHRLREAEAEDNFRAVMGNNDWSRVQSQRRPAKNAVSAGSSGAALSSPAQQAGPSGSGAGGEVVVPLPRYEAVRTRVEAMDRSDRQPDAPLVVLGASSFTGEALDGALSLRLELGVTLGAEGLWKTVPLVGEEVVVVQARLQGSGAELPLSRQNGYHVWITPDEGEVTLLLDLLVPSRGRRGSLEYDFLVAKTPVTRFDCSFPTAGLEPRLRSAVRSELSDHDKGVRLTASLEPTSRIHLVGFKDVGDDEGRTARIYAESLNLLSVDEGGHDLFTVVRFNILYAGARHFELLIPEGMTVVSADGQGAFRYVLEPGEGGTLLRGETAFPIRDEYEISLRLRKEIARDRELFDLELPRCQGVEREYGWLGVEVVGNLRLEEAERRGMLAVDVRQLPWEMVQSAVSPILRAYRFHTAEAGVRLEAQRLPEQEPATGSVDLVEASSTVSREGAVLTDLRITLRNRLRHSLALALPEGASVRSARLDGEPVKPGVAEDGTLFFPLKRSAGAHGLRAFTLQIVLEEQRGPLGLLGHPDFELPALGLPASTLHWEVFLPANNDYTRLQGDIEPQVHAGSGRWFEGGVVSGSSQAGQAQRGSFQEPSRSAGTGAMPVRIELPTEGKRLSYTRYWLEADAPVRIQCWYLRRWVRVPVASLVGLLLVLFVVLGTAKGPRGRGAWLRRAAALAAVVPLVLVLHGLGTSAALVPAVLLGVVIAAVQRGWHRKLWGGLLATGRQLGRSAGPPPQTEDDGDGQLSDEAAGERGAWHERSPVGQLALLAALCFLLLFSAVTLLRLLVTLT